MLQLVLLDLMATIPLGDVRIVHRIVRIVSTPLVSHAHMDISFTIAVVFRHVPLALSHQSLLVYA